ncbi:MAG: endonuclease NucS [Candidatus Altiarchaeota archaeon]|nr:endonuclease NucS [Candidatus Altiarchaeota archaeon]
MQDNAAICRTLQEDVDAAKTIVIACRCAVEYWGRSRSIAGAGDRVILLKPDTTLIIHSLSGFKPLNWMSPPTDTAVENESGALLIHSQRTIAPYEEIRIKVEKLHDYRAYDGLADTTKLELSHNEQDMQKYLVENPRLIDEGLTVKSTGYRSPLGFFDIYGKIGGKYAVIELKSQRAGLPAALQLKRYRDWLTSHLKEDVIAMLVAPSITPNALVLLRKEKLLYKAFSLKKIQRKSGRKGKTLEDWCS